MTHTEGVMSLNLNLCLKQPGRHSCSVTALAPTLRRAGHIADTSLVLQHCLRSLSWTWVTLKVTFTAERQLVQ